MKKDEAFLKAMNGINDEYIEEAQHAVKPKKRMKKAWYGLGLAAALVVGFGISSITGSIMHNTKGAAMESLTNSRENYYTNNVAPDAVSKQETDLGYLSEKNDDAISDVSALFVPFDSENTKLVYTADINIETTNFDETLTTLKDLVNYSKGYFEKIENSNGGYYYSGSSRYGYFTVRVPSSGYDSFLKQLSSNFHVSRIEQNVKDISLQYSDVEGKLNTLKIKRDRLQDLLKAAANVSEMIEIESSLSDIEYQIEMYSGQLKQYDSKVNYSTIGIYVGEVSRVGEGIDVDNDFFSRLGRSVISGINNFLDDVADFINWVAYNIIGIAIAAVVVIFGIKIVKKIIRKRKAE